MLCFSTTKQTVLSSLRVEAAELCSLSLAEIAASSWEEQAVLLGGEIALSATLDRGATWEGRWEGWDGLWQEQGLHLRAEFQSSVTLGTGGGSWWGGTGKNSKGFLLTGCMGWGCSPSGMGPSRGHGIPWESVPAGHFLLEIVFILL